MSTINGKACVANGRNLYIDTKNFDNPDIWSYYSRWRKSADKFNGLTVMEANTDWFGLGQDVQAKKGEVYTFSLYARYESGTGNSNMYFVPTGSTVALSQTSATFSLNETWQRISATFSVNADGVIHPRIERTADNTNTLMIAGLKLERGSKATDYSPVPVDKVFSNGKLVYGRNLLKNTRTLSSTSTTNYWDVLFDSSQVYNSGIKSLSGVSAMTFSVNVYIPLNVVVGQIIPIQLKGQNSKATNVGSDEWNTLIGYSKYAVKQNDLGKTIRVSIPVAKDHKYQSFDTALADTASVTIRQSSNIPGFVYSRIKLETGSVATPWTPAPEDVLPDYVRNLIRTDPFNGYPGIGSHVIAINTTSSLSSSGEVTVTEQDGAPELYYRFINPSLMTLAGLTPGESYRLTGSIKGNLSSGKYITTRNQYRSSTDTAWRELPNTMINISNNYSSFSAVLTIPSNASAFYFSLSLSGTGAMHSGDTFTFKDIMFTKDAGSDVPYSKAPEDI